MRLLTGLAATGATLHARADDDPAGQEITAGIMKAIPSTWLWRFALRAPLTPRYEEQDIDVLLRDLDGRRDTSIPGQAGSLSLRGPSRTPVIAVSVGRVGRRCGMGLWTTVPAAPARGTAAAAG